MNDCPRKSCFISSLWHQSSKLCSSYSLIIFYSSTSEPARPDSPQTHCPNFMQSSSILRNHTPAMPGPQQQVNQLYACNCLFSVDYSPCGSCPPSEKSYVCGCLAKSVRLNSACSGHATSRASSAVIRDYGAGYWQPSGSSRTGHGEDRVYSNDPRKHPGAW